MSYNQAYEQDTGENISYNSFYILDVIRRNTLLPVIKGPKIPPPPPPPPPFGSSTIDYSSLNQYTLNSIGSGWTQIKYLPGTSDAWFPGNNNLLAYTGTEFLFTRGDFSAWLVCDKDQVNGEYYADDPRTIKKSSISAVPYTARWYFRPPGSYADEDPWVSLEDIWVSIEAGTMMYGENRIMAFLDSIHPTGMYVFIR